jgi:peptidoglycan/LPS O-acetylase OafA/YrhL
MKISQIRSTLGESSLQDTLFNYRPDIDGLRGLAVLAVIVFHLNKDWMPGGFTGVDIFFVISGYVVTSSVLKHEITSLSTYLLEFYGRRVRRILPNTIVCILVTSLLVSLLISPDQTSNMFSSGVSALFGFSNLYLIKKSGDYFGLDQDLNPFLQTWSLGVEEQFYLVFPLLVAICYRLKRSIQNFQQNLFRSLVFFAIVSGIISWMLTLKQGPSAYYLMPSRFWELASGSLLFIVLLRRRQPITLNPGIFRTALQGIASILILVPLYIAPIKGTFPFPWAIFSVLGTLILIYIGALTRDRPALMSQWISNPFLLYVGKISFSLYLWHWSVMTLLRWTLGLNSIYTQSLALGLTLLLSLASYRWIETPFRNAGRVGSMRLILQGLSSAALVAVVITFLIQPASANLFLDKSMSTASRPWWPRECFLEKFDAEKAKSCLLQNEKKESPTRTVYLLGDSHAGNLLDMLREGEKELSYRVRELTFGSRCGYKPSSLIIKELEAQNKCQDYNQFINTELLANINPGDSIVISSTRYNLMPLDYDLNVFTNLSDEKRQRIISSLEENSKKLENYIVDLGKMMQKKKASVVLVGDLPMLRRDPRLCSDVWWRKGSSAGLCNVSQTISNQHILPLSNAFQGAANEMKNISFWNPHDLFCESGTCSYKVRGFSYVDNGHISVEFSQSLYPDFRAWLKSQKIWSTTSSSTVEKTL